MHLGSYLGYLIGKECAGQDEECKIVVISKDTGFDHIIEFWKTEKDVKVSRNEKISGKQVQTRKQVKKQTKDQMSSVCQNKASYPVVFGVSGVSGSGWVKPIPAWNR